MMDRKEAKALVPYLVRAAQREDVREQARHAASALSDAYSRARRQGLRSAGDKKVQRELSDAASALRRAVGAVQEPPRKRRRGGVLLLLGGVGAAAFALLKARTASSPET